MRKLMLNLDALEVETFVVEGLEGHSGTVGAAEAPTDKTQCGTCHTNCTCGGWTCDRGKGGCTV
jgi:hypothetical protein